MNRYKSYKDSGVEWIGEIPKHWFLSKFKYESLIYNGDSLSDDKKILFESDDNENQYPYISTKNIEVNYSKVDYDSGLKIPISETKYKVAPIGSFLLCIEGGSAGRKIAYLNQDVCFVNKLACFVSNNNTKLLFYYAKSTNFQTQFKLSMSGLIGGVAISSIRNFDLVLPPLHEQEQIVAYLDKKTAIIDTLISSKEEKIALLKEKRTALINHVITKGLNPNVEFKDSGVEWIGEIPKHWEMKKLKYLFQIQKRISGELGYEVLSITQKGIKIKDIESGKGQVSMDYTKYQIVEIGDFAMNHMDLLTGYIDISPYKGVTSPDYRVFTKTDEKINSRFYLSLFQFGYTNKVFYGFGQGSSMFGRWRLPSTEFNNFKLPYPSLEEQNQIVDYLDNQFQEIDETISLEEQKIITLKEYRQALISEVVTGKIKVVRD
jgi:type I restriction enzyme S subunit